MGKNHKKRNLIRSAYSGKIINGREVILTAEAEEYLKQMGYILIRKNKDKSFNEVMKKAIGFVLLPFLIPFISAAPVALFTIDFSLWENRIILIILFALAAMFIFLMENTLWGGALIAITGMLMAFNSINLIVSLLVIGIGVVILSAESKA